MQPRILIANREGSIDMPYKMRSEKASGSQRDTDDSASVDRV